MDEAATEDGSDNAEASSQFYIPEALHGPAFTIVLSLLSPSDLRCLRLTNKGMRRNVDSSLPRLKIRALKSGQQLAEKFSRLTDLDLTASVGLPDHELAHLTHLRLTALALQGSYKTGAASLQQVAGITTLRMLRFEHGKALTDPNTAALGGLTRLERLSLRGCDGVRGLHLTVLRACPQLQALDLGACIGLVAAGVEAVAGLTALTALDLSGYADASLSFVGNADESHLTAFHGLRDVSTGLTGLRRLSLRGSVHASDGLLRELARWSPNLTALDLGLCTAAVRGAGVRALGAMVALRELSLEGCLGCGAAALGALTALTMLTRLHAPARFDDDCARAVAAIRSLQTLEADDALELTDGGLAELGRRLTALTRLRLDNALGAGSEGLLFFVPARMRLASLRLTKLDLVNDRAAALVARHAGLTEVHLSECPFLTDAAAVALAALPALAALRLDGAEALSDAGAAALGPLAHTLTSLDLSNTLVGNVGVCALCWGPSRLGALCVLRLARTRIGDEALRGVAGLRSLRTLSLAATLVTDNGLAHLAPLTALSELEVAHCRRVSNEGVATALAPLTRHSLACISVLGCPNVTADVRPLMEHVRVIGLSHRRGTQRWPPIMSMRGRGA